MDNRRPILVLAALSGAWLIVRAIAATRVGFGDSEALYACYALHPQPAYLDHPGLIGMFARFIGHGGAPTPPVAHAWTGILATLVPWLCALAARAAGSSWRTAAFAGVAIAVIPETAVGLFAMTPDLLLAIGWLGALGLAAGGLREKPDSNRAAMLLLGAGLVTGIACAAKVSAIPLGLALGATYLTQPARAHARTIWPWAGLLAGATVAMPILLYEAKTGWPMLHHRLVSTQGGAGLSFRNAGAVTLGQLAYLSPPFCVLAFLVAKDLWNNRDEDVVSVLLVRALVIPMALLLPLCLWSSVAEPHWLAPPLLALPVFWAVRATAGSLIGSSRLRTYSVGIALALSACVHVWVLVPQVVRLLPQSFDPRLDIATELYGWPEAINEVKKTILGQPRENGLLSVDDVVVVGPHWTVCAQLHAALGPDIGVGCATPVPDDFDGWLPRERWQHADAIIYVSDNRFDVDARSIFPNRIRTWQKRLTIPRGNRVGRVFTIGVYERRADALLE